MGRRPRRRSSIDLSGGQWHNMSCAALPRPAPVKAGAMYHTSYIICTVLSC